MEEPSKESVATVVGVAMAMHESLPPTPTQICSLSCPKIRHLLTYNPTAHTNHRPPRRKAPASKHGGPGPRQGEFDRASSRFWGSLPVVLCDLMMATPWQLAWTLARRASFGLVCGYT